MPLDTRRLFLIAAGATLAVGQQAGQMEGAVLPLILLALAVLGVRWARVVVAFVAAFFAVLAGYGWASYVLDGGAGSSDDSSILAGLTMWVVVLLCVTSPAVKQWVSPQPPVDPSPRTISQSAPG